jgi:hypothetical protein
VAGRVVVWLYGATGIVQVVDQDGVCRFSGLVAELSDADVMADFVVAILNAIPNDAEFRVHQTGEDIDA